MKKFRAVLSAFLAVIMLLFCGAPQIYAESGSVSIDSTYSIYFTDEACSRAAEYLAGAISKSFGTKIEISANGTKRIELSLGGSALDYSVRLDKGTGNILLSGGCPEALERAVNAFLTSAFAGKLTVTDSVDYEYIHAEDAADNSGYLKYAGDEPELVTSLTDGVLRSPGWLDSLIMVEVRPDTASIGGSLPECYDLLDFYAEAGVNAIWLTPIYDKGTVGNGYSNYGPHTVDPRLTGKSNYAEGWQEVRKFVDYAHSKGIYIFLDVITWGVVYNSPLIAEHPDWFSGEAWGNIAFDWSNPGLNEWFTETLVNNILVTGADGYRCDCEPFYVGYDLYGDVRERLAAKGKYIAIMSESASTRSSVYDIEQEGVFDYASMDRAALYSNPVNFFTDGYLDIVDTVRSGKGMGTPDWQSSFFKRGSAAYYTNCITNHDYQRRCVCGNRLKIGYAAILAPFIPIWYMGDEFNVSSVNAVQYDIPVDYSESLNTPNAFFLEDVKRMTGIRREYADIFDRSALNHRNSNICEVKTDGFGTLQNYARFADGRAVIVIGNNDPDSVSGRVNIPFRKCGIGHYKAYRITDLMTGRVILSGNRAEVSSFNAFVPFENVGAFLIEGVGDPSGFCIDFAGLFTDFSEFFLSLFIRLFYHS